MNEAEPPPATGRRATDEFSLDGLDIGDRIAYELVPRHPGVDAGQSVAAHSLQLDASADTRTFCVRLIARGEDGLDFEHAALVFDPEAGVFARIGTNARASLMTDIERDWIVCDVGERIVATDAWDVEIPDVPDPYTKTFLDQWIEALFEKAREGADITSSFDSFDGKTFTVQDGNGRTATIQYELRS